VVKWISLRHECRGLGLPRRLEVLLTAGNFGKHRSANSDGCFFPNSEISYFLIAFRDSLFMILNIYKPKGPTSNDVLNQIRRKLGTKKVGHAGTLDPLASGVLVVGIAEGTKALANIVKDEKEYVADIFLGATSATDDAEGPIYQKTQKQYSDKLENLRMVDVSRALENFIGKIQQTPPLYSAVKVAGKEAYKYARQGKALILKPREVEIKSIEILKYDWPRLTLKVVTGPGVYIRRLARDLGQILGCGAYLADLVRTRVGQFAIEKAMLVENLK